MSIADANSLANYKYHINIKFNLPICLFIKYIFLNEIALIKFYHLILVLDSLLNITIRVLEFRESFLILSKICSLTFS